MITKKFSLLLALQMSFAFSVVADNLLIKKGWNLVGGLETSELDKSKFKAVYAYREKWIEGASSSFYLSKQDGVWIYSENDTTIEFAKVDYGELDIQKGWNLVSAIEDTDVLDSAKINAYFTYLDGSWMTNPSSVSYTQGVWINASSATTLEMGEATLTPPATPIVNSVFRDSDVLFDDADYVKLDKVDRRVVIDKILSTFFLGLPKEELDTLIESKTAITDIKRILSSSGGMTISEIEGLIDAYSFSSQAVAEKALARLLFMSPTREYVDIWSAYNLLNSKFFSASRELSSVMNSNGTNLFQRFYANLQADMPISEMLFDYLVSEEHWRRFRSPEDNTREVMELQLGIFDDSLVPTAAKACQNYSYSESDSNLVIDFNYNTETLSLFDSQIVSCEDFYRVVANKEEIKAKFVDYFLNFYFPLYDEESKEQIKMNVLALENNTYRDMLLNIVFLDEYVLNSVKQKTIEELFISSAKKTTFYPGTNTFKDLREISDTSGQPIMYYKLGRELTPPNDVLSYSIILKNFRELLMINEKSNLFSDWDSGWSGEFSNSLDWSSTEEAINSIFLVIAARNADTDEISSLVSMLGGLDINLQSNRLKVIKAVMDYLSQIPETYVMRSVGGVV